jgi:hypothetical protein
VQLYRPAANQLLALHKTSSLFAKGEHL